MAEAIAAIASVIGILQATAASYVIISKIIDKPRAFDVVGEHTGLILVILKRVHAQLVAQSATGQIEQDHTEVSASKKILTSCESKAQDLKRIFDEILEKSQHDQSATSWTRVRVWYRHAVKGIKANRVETLMNEIFQGVQRLGQLHLFKLATQDDVDSIQRAIDELTQVEPSLPDAEFDNKHTINANQTVESNAWGQQNIPSGGVNTFVSGKYNVTGESATVHFGTDHGYLRHLSGADDPRAIKARIQREKGGLHVESCRWVLSHLQFQQWSCNEQGGILHVVGDPGKGKTMLLCAIIEELEERLNDRITNSPATLLYFFCRADEDRLNNATAVLRGLLTCLFSDRSDLFDKYQRANKTKRFPLNVNNWDTLRAFFDTIIRDVALGDLYIVIDALDECTEELGALLELIRGLFTTKARILVSSRNWHNILNHLKPSEKHRSLSLELNADAVSAAVTAFIDWKVEWLAQRMDYDPQTKLSVSNHLHQNSTHTFLWVSLVCDVLGQPDVESWEVPELLKALPRKLQSLYRSIATALLQSGKAKLACSILAVALTVKRPVTLSELRHLVDWPAAFPCDHRSLESALGYCKCLLNHRGSGISLIHQSATDFLLDRTEFIFQKIFPRGMLFEHAAIASRSMKVMAEVLRKNIYNLPDMDAVISHWDVPIPDPLEPIWYPCEYWTQHLDMSTTSNRAAGAHEQHMVDSSEQEGQIYNFLTRDLLHWLEALSLRRESSIASGAMNTLKRLATTHYNRLRDLVDDAWRFVHYHGDAIALGPSQIYNSIVLFSPEKSAIRNLYDDGSPSWLEVKPRMELHWPETFRIIEGHKKAVTCLAHSEDGSLLAPAQLTRPFGSGNHSPAFASRLSVWV